MAAVFKNIGGASALPAHWAATPLPIAFVAISTYTITTSGLHQCITRK